METVSIELKVNEVNSVLSALGQLPFIQVADLINNIKTQAETQLAAEKVKAESVAE
jgi:hypothetical protein